MGSDGCDGQTEPGDRSLIYLHPPLGAFEDGRL